MIVQFLSSNSRFAAIKYNADKVSAGKAELMCVKNFQSLSVLDKPKPSDYRSYLRMIGALNPKVKNKQLHAVIMAKGHSYDKRQLTHIAGLWLEKMGYANNPHLIYFHNDNTNNHVHIVSVRVCKNRKSVESRYEKLRASLALHQLIGFDPVAQAEMDYSKAITYQFTTLDQFTILLKTMGYSAYIRATTLYMVRHSRSIRKVDLNVINNIIKSYKHNSVEVSALKQAIELSLKVVSGTPVRHPSFWHSYLRKNYKSDLSEAFREKLNIDIIYHTKGGDVIGFTLINHRTKRVYDGSEILDFKRLVRPLVRPEGFFQGDRIIFYDDQKRYQPNNVPNLAVKMSGGAFDSENKMARRGR
ncbi:relaxase/mobilization nuclease domain-containing protein [Pedobacter miscanthi]|uniref:relaxase/mobilization nuclease domain-containing protein n=1 Tax=Pedobacter miscanthi TaxID=2259170 RepID=UPI0029310C95|nr:hypothetical protein [Pedobacter miscanthi]